MGYKELSLVDFQRLFDSNEACLEAIFNARWPKGFICPKCCHDDGTRLSKRRAIQCKLCRKQTSITAGTVFHKTKIPLTSWFWLIFLMTQDKGGISTMRASTLLGMHYTTVWFIMHKLREAMADRLEGPMLSGFVEIDDAFFGGKSPGKPGRATATKRKVCVMVERLNRKAGDAAMVVLTATGYRAYVKAVETHLEPMTHVRTDGLTMNSTLHGTVGNLNMTKIGKLYEQGSLENVDRVISLAKRYLLGTYHQYCKRAHLQRFLNEFCYRFNRRYSWYQLASRLLAACALRPPIPHAAI
jgi:ISXO2-like transposase domain/Transposase zinc-ribbon domain